MRLRDRRRRKVKQHRRQNFWRPWYKPLGARWRWWLWSPEPYEIDWSWGYASLGVVTIRGVSVADGEGNWVVNVAD